MIVQLPHTETPPRCWNRPPFADVYTRHGIDRKTGEAIAVTVSNGWFTDGCATWAGRGIGPTEETTHYPQAHGWAGWCKSCRWLPAFAKKELGL